MEDENSVFQKTVSILTDNPLIAVGFTNGGLDSRSIVPVAEGHSLALSLQ